MKIEPVVVDEKKLEEILAYLKFDEKGLIPAVVQDAGNGEVLMVAYMNKESLKRSLQSGRAWFFSRSRQSLWLKGETSGNYQFIREVLMDCDADTLLVLVDQQGVACHTGARSCFYRSIEGERVDRPNSRGIIDELYRVIEERRQTLPDGSYTAKLFKKGLDKIVQKVGEEAVEVVIAGKNRDREEIIEETSDLLYHLLVMLVACDVSPEDVRAKLAERRR